ncbi:acylamino-acid-releasing enzyme-like isoform X2 [Punica granatum]|uniref:acylaminoacyl-peptidase n=1 Tax=Punica granatum TaxID=22663 RepID=A0A6P8CDI6_PUNGR|nr:acylamino-acid-releasing enzyme-like isoform X2 [Punica granatum]
MATLLHHFCSSSTFSNGCVKNPLQFQIRPVSFRFIFPPHPRRISLSPQRLLVSFSMDSHGAGYPKEAPFGVDMAMEEEYAAQSKLLQDFVSICNIERAWTFKSENGKGSMGMFSVSQPNLLANKRKKFIISAHISKERTEAPTFQWSPFPVEMTGVSTIVPSPSGSKLLVVRNADNECPTQFEIWSHCQLENEFQIAQSVHGSVYTDGWFEGISWNSEENLIAYVAEVPAPPKPTFNSNGYKKGGSNEKDCSSWKGQGEFEEEWGETYAGKRQPGIFVINLESGEVRTLGGISKSLSVGQVVWAPEIEGIHQYLVFVGWSADKRKLGIKYCYNRPCALYSGRSPFHCEANEVESKNNVAEDFPLCNLTPSISSACHPRFSPDGKYLLFLSCKSSVDSGAHSATNSLHRIHWLIDGKLNSSETLYDVIPIIMNSEEGSFPGLYCLSLLKNPWLSDGRTMVLTSIWGSIEVILTVDVLSGNVSRVSPVKSNSSWSILALDRDNILAVTSSPVDVPQINYGLLIENSIGGDSWRWWDISSPIFKCSEKVKKSLSTLQFNIMKIPVKDVSDCRTKGATKPYEAIFVSSEATNPLIVILHGGPHSVSLASFTKSSAFLSSLGFNLLIVNYRGSLGFGEEALQSLLGRIGSQDVNDVIAAIDHLIHSGLTNPSKIAVLGGSHGGFLTTHLIGQAPDRFAAAAARNPVCNLALMTGTTDIPDWCYVESCGPSWKENYTEAPSAEHLSLFHSKSPISHISKVKTPTLFLLGAQDLRVPVSNGLQYARALKERGVDCKIIVFPSDVHSIDKPQSDFESFLNIGVWFKKYCT